MNATYYTYFNNKSLIYDHVEYNIGFNLSNGLKFTDKNNIAHYLEYDSIYIAEIIISKDIQVYKDPIKMNTWTCNYFYINKLYTINVWNGWNNKRIRTTAVENNCHVIRWIPNKYITDELYLLAINRGYSLYNVPEEFKTEPVCRAAIHNNYYEISLIPEKFITEALYISIIKRGYPLQFVPEKFKTKELCEIAIDLNKHAMEYTQRI